MSYLKEFLKAMSLLLIITGICLHPFNNKILAASENWQKIASDSNGIQFIDTESIKYKGDILSLKTKYESIDPDSKELIYTNGYNLEIDCTKRLFKEEGLKWQSSLGSKLITETIIESCTY